MKNAKNSKMPKRQAAGKPASQTADYGLQFPPGDRCGITSISLSVGKHNPPAIAREILQNSLDAAKHAGRQCARVLFSLESVEVADIPGIADYKNALDKCEKFWRTRSKHTQAMEVLGGIRRRLEQKSVPALFVCDNGIGLDKSRMQAILSDGISDQNSPGATGSHGNGHFTAFNLSGLRYLLYGGISEKNGRLASGHAMLCSHQGDKGACGKNGYLAVEVKNDLNDPFVFPSNDGIPKVIADNLDEIESKEKTGAMLAALDFNYFGDDNKSPEHVADLILGVAARNFFVAVAQGELVVAVKTGNSKRTLDASNLQKTMEEISPKIANNRNFPRHETSQRFYRLFDDADKQQGEAKDEPVKTNGYSMRVLYRQGAASTKIALCRNGMWITDSVPSVKPYHFAGHAAFEALLLCDADDSGELVRMAEGNLHNDLTLATIADNRKRKDLRKILQAVCSRLQEVIEKQDEESISFVDIDGTGRISVSRTAGRITPSKEKLRPTGGKETGGGETGGTKAGRKTKSKGTAKPKPGKALSVRHTAVQKGDGKMDIRIQAMESSPEVELRLVCSGGGDFSCVNPSANDRSIRLSRVFCGGEECAIKDGGVVRIGKVEQDEEKIIQVEFDAPKVQGHYRVDYEFIRRSPPASP